MGCDLEQREQISTPRIITPGNLFPPRAYNRLGEKPRHVDIHIVVHSFRVVLALGAARSGDVSAGLAIAAALPAGGYRGHRSARSSVGGGDAAFPDTRDVDPRLMQ